MDGPSEKQKAAVANRLKNKANIAVNENVDSKPAFSSSARSSAPVPSLDVEAMEATSTPPTSAFLPVQQDPAATVTSSTEEKFMAMVDAADDESKATIYSASVLFKMVNNAKTEEGRKKNDKITDEIFGPETGDAPTSVEDSILDSHGNLDFSKAAIHELNKRFRASAPVADPWDLARMPRSSDEDSSSSPAGPASPSLGQEQYQDVRSDLTHDERVARLGELMEALETEDARRNLEDDQPEFGSQSPATAEDTAAVTTEQPAVPAATATSDQSAVATAQPAPAQSSAPRRPVMTMRDLAGLVKQLLEASAARFDRDNLCCIFDINNAIEIFGADRFILKSGQPRKVLRPGTAVYKNLQRAGLPPGVYRWLNGIPDLAAEFKYPAATIIETVNQLTARGI